MPATLILEHYSVLTRADGSLHELGRGAMGITYKGFDTRLRVPVALKVVNAAYLSSENVRQRFVREARAAAQLRHRNVASVIHLGEEGGDFFYVMEFIDGETVEAMVRRQGPLTPVFALRIAAQVARALNAAQQHGLVHRDIKPSNLMAVVEDDDLVIKVIDFGLAKTQAGEEEPSGAPLTHGGFIGTPHFASPEQLEERETDARSDIYSLGVTLWYLLRGTTPFHGSIARVIGQHLSKPPPLEELDSMPSGVVELLRRMLAKDPAARPQSPAQLRAEIEQCLHALNSPLRGPPSPKTAAKPSSRTSAPPEETEEDETRFQTGITIARRYLITQELGESEAWTSFIARDLREGGEVRMLVLHRALLADRERFAQIESEASALTALAHPNVLKVFEFQATGNNAFLAMGKTNGFTLRQLLRVRRELPPAEAGQLLSSAAAGLDEAVAHLPRLELGLHHVMVHFPGRETAPDELLPQPISQWPEFVVQINPLATWRDFFAVTWAAGQTLVATYQERISHPGRAGAIQALGALAYELLGGVAPAHRAREYSPLAALDEDGNTVLQRAFVAPESFASATSFVEQIGGSFAGGLEPVPFTPVPSPPPAPIEESVSVSVKDPIPAEEPAGPAGITEEPLPKRGPSRRFLIPCALLLATTAISYVVFHHRRDGGESSATRQLATPLTSPDPSSLPPLARLTTPAPTAPSPTASPRPTTPSPPPSRLDLASAARRGAEALEARQQSREATSAWLRMNRDFPEFDTGRLGLELLLDRLRRRPGGLGRSEFAAMQGEIRQSAKLGVVAAMMILGDELRETDPAQAFAWYCAAAERGEPLAMTEAGLMLSNGAGTPRDLRKAIAYFQAASDEGEPGGTVALAECYLNGDGVAADPKRALALLRKAAAKGYLRAMNRLGWCYHQGIGAARDPREAFRLFTEAADGGSVEAIANLGVLYMKGEGVEKNEVKAAEKFKEASLKGDAHGTYYYADCLENGRGVKANAEAATKLFQKAAGEGETEAIEWCKKHGLSPSPKLDSRMRKD